MLLKERPDFVFALGKHCDMAGTAQFLLEEGISFAMEKPMGLNAGAEDRKRFGRSDMVSFLLSCLS